MPMTSRRLGIAPEPTAGVVGDAFVASRLQFMHGSGLAWCSNHRGRGRAPPLQFALGPGAPWWTPSWRPAFRSCTVRRGAPCMNGPRAGTSPAPTSPLQFGARSRLGIVHGPGPGNVGDALVASRLQFMHGSGNGAAPKQPLRAGLGFFGRGCGFRTRTPCEQPSWRRLADWSTSRGPSRRRRPSESHGLGRSSPFRRSRQTGMRRRPGAPHRSSTFPNHRRASSGATPLRSL